MTDEKFTKARNSLLFSQNLADAHRSKMRPQQSMEEVAPEGAPEIPSETPPNAPQTQENPGEEKGIIQGVVEAIKPMLDDISGMLTNKEEEPKEAVLKVEGTLEPKEDKTPEDNV